MLPSVLIQEIDNSIVSENFSGEIGAYVGMFEKGTLNEPVLITSVAQFKTVFGRGVDHFAPYWYQVYNYLQYSSGIYVMRVAGNDTYNATSEVTSSASTNLENVLGEIGDYILSDKSILTNYEEEYTNDLLTLDSSTFNVNTYPQLYSLLGTNVLENKPAPDGAPFDYYKVIADGDDTRLVYVTISDQDDFYESYNSIQVELNTGVMFVAETAGEGGNLLSVYVVDHDDYTNNIDVFGTGCSSLFSYFSDEYVGIVVARNEDIKEIFYVSLSDIAASTNDYKTIPFESQYVYAKFEDFSILNKGLFEFSGGVTQIPTEDDYQNGHDVFENKSTYVIDNFIANQDVPEQAISLVEDRLDMIVFVGLPVKKVTNYLAFCDDELGDDGIEDVWVDSEGDFLIEFGDDMSTDYDVDGVKEFLSTISESSHVVVVNNIKEQYDGYTENTILVNLAGDMAGLKSQTSLKNMYLPGAGLVNGKIKNLEKAHLTWKKSELTEMYDLNCNYVLNGCIQSQRTFVDEDTSYSRVNVRALFNHIEREIEYINLNTVFEFADAITLTKIKSTATKILDTAISNKGISDYYIKVEAEINSTVITDPNEIMVSVYIKPNYIAEYIILKVHNNGSTDTE